MHFELHLRPIRDECALTIAEVSDQIGHSPGFVSRLERGERLPKLLTLLRLARVYDRHPFDLITFFHFPAPRTRTSPVCAVCGARRVEVPDARP